MDDWPTSAVRLRDCAREMLLAYLAVKGLHEQMPRRLQVAVDALAEALDISKSDHVTPRDRSPP